MVAGGPDAGRVGRPQGQSGGRERLEQALGERRGWCLGEEAFRKELLALMSERLGAEHYGEERKESAVGWIAGRLQMGTRGHLNHMLYRRRQAVK